MHRWSREANNEAIALFHKAVELDPEFASAYGMAGRCYSQRKVSGWIVDHQKEQAEARWLADRAVECGHDDAVALATAGIALDYVVGDVVRGSALIEHALVLNPNYAWGWLFNAWSKMRNGEPETAIDRISRGMRLSPNDPHSFIMQSALGCAHYLAEHYEQALACGKLGLRDKPDLALALCVIAAAAAMLERSTEAKQAIARLIECKPDLRLSNVDLLLGAWKPDILEKWLTGLRAAGLPE